MQTEEIINYINRNCWCERLGKSRGMLISGFYDVMFVIFLNAKLLTYFNGETGAMVSLDHPNFICYDEIYELLIEIQTPLSALVAAGPCLFESLYGSDRWALDKKPVEPPHYIGCESNFSLSDEEIDKLELVLVEDHGYGRDLCESVLELSEISGGFCRQSHSFYNSALSTEEVAVSLMFSYVEKAKVCASKGYLRFFP